MLRVVRCTRPAVARAPAKIVAPSVLDVSINKPIDMRELM